MTSVSRRVIEKARRKPSYLKDLEMVSASLESPTTLGSLNIELLISLIENSKINGWEHKTRFLKKLVEEDIKGILTAPRIKRFYLHKALLEFHEHEITQAKEQVIALFSLNYDTVLDGAYKTVLEEDPNYCLCLKADDPSPERLPLLKLHGSFNWNPVEIRGRKRTIGIIPLGSNKNYLHSPYGFIWSRALEILIECDTLRVIGCSLSQNDAHLVDLLFKAHLDKGAEFGIEIIASEESGEMIRANYGFFPRIKTLSNLNVEPNPSNPFKAWLRYKSEAMPEKILNKTRYLRKVRE